MSERDDRSDAALLAAAGTDPEAFGVFYRRHERSVLAFVGRLAGSAELGADVMAETFAVAFEIRQRFEPARGDARSWLFGIAHNILRSSWRRGRVEATARHRLGMEQLAFSEDQLSAFDQVIASDGHATVEQWLRTLPRQQRDALRLRVLEDRPYGSIAVDLECSEAVVRQRVSRGLATLREQIGKNR
jgi:RNA polymerase sigma factor (sigma-70 family)